jgi:hypothetical protein
MIKVVILRGGLGNQMFGYAFALQLKKKFPFSLVLLDMLDSFQAHNGFEFYKVFKPVKSYKYKSYKLLRKITSKYFSRYLFSRIVEDSSDYATFCDVYLKPHCKFTIYDGFWQSEKYFKSVEKSLRNNFKFDLNVLNPKSIEFLQLIQENNSASIHIRRGDYLNHESVFGNICTREYYSNAMIYLESSQKSLMYFIFTDDVDWVKKNYNIPNSFIVDCNVGDDSWQDMCLMSYCKHNIIANSTFSWWGAWLNSNENKIVVAPNQWFVNSDTTDIIPETWIKI